MSGSESNPSYVDLLGQDFRKIRGGYGIGILSRDAFKISGLKPSNMHNHNYFVKKFHNLTFKLFY